MDISCICICCSVASKDISCIIPLCPIDIPSIWIIWPLLSSAISWDCITEPFIPSAVISVACVEPYTISVPCIMPPSVWEFWPPYSPDDDIDICICTEVSPTTTCCPSITWYWTPFWILNCCPSSSCDPIMTVIPSPFSESNCCSLIIWSCIWDSIFTPNISDVISTYPPFWISIWPPTIWPSIWNTCWGVILADPSFDELAVSVHAFSCKFRSEELFSACITCMVLSTIFLSCF